MFGLWRYLLALLVMQSHLWPGAAPWTGFYAVFSFYLLSGYLMAMVLCTTYGPGVTGRGRFIINRALRIYPLYYAAFLAAVIIAAAVPDGAGRLVRVFRFPFSLEVWVHQFSLFGLTWDRSRLVPQAWSLEVELLFYLLMAFGLARSRRTTLVWLTLSAVYTAILLFRAECFADRYYHAAAASLPFSVGAALWFAVKDKSLPIPRRVAAASVALYLLHSAVAGSIWSDPTFTGLYVSTLLSAGVVLCLSGQGHGSRMTPWGRADRFLGNLSYPLFLIHWSVAVVLVTAGVTDGLGAGLFFASVPVGSAAALIMHSLIQRRVDGLRNTVRFGDDSDFLFGVGPIFPLSLAPRWRRIDG